MPRGVRNTLIDNDKWLAEAFAAVLEALDREGIGVGLAPRMVLEDGKPTLTFIARLQMPAKPSNSANAAVS
jgi:hypothetical protein